MLKELGKVRLIRCKSQGALKKTEDRLVKMHKRVAILHKKDLGNRVSSSISRSSKFHLSKVDVVLVLDEES